MSFIQNQPVIPSEDFVRIKKLPRRSEPDPQCLQLTGLLRTPEGQATLRPIQAQALWEAGENNGLFGAIRVGGGKTLLSLLLPYVVEARRPLLLLPAALVDKTERERRVYARDWRVAKNLRISSYEMLGRVNAARELEFYRPDCIIADECHRLKNKRAGVTRRVARYMEKYPDTRFFAFSGTVMGKSIKDFAHIVEWTHKQGAPVPLADHTLIEWSEALDEKINPLARRPPGALLELASKPVDGSQLERARRSFHSRFVQTAGIVATSNEETYNGSIYLRAIEYDVKPVTETNFETLRTKWETPDGWAETEAVAIWRHARELALGFHYVWDPRPHDEWLVARRIWAKFVRDVLTKSHKLDTEFQVLQAVRAGEVGAGEQELRDWESAKPTFKIHAKPVWHDTTALELCERWANDHKDNGIIWTEHNFFARELSRRASLPYFGPGGVDAHGKSIESAQGCIVASRAANCTGRNLQRWNANLVTSVSSSAIIWEQLIGRTHRDGQEADEIQVDVLAGCYEHINGLHRAMAGAKAQQDLLGQTQKLLLADTEWPSEHELSKRAGRGWRWTKVVEEDEVVINEDDEATG